MKKIRQNLENILRLGLPILINSILYYYNLVSVIEGEYIILAILATSGIEIVIFNNLFDRKPVVRILQGFLYLAAILLKVSNMLYFKQYGVYDMFSRWEQAVYLLDVAAYIKNQITFPVILVLALSAFYLLLVASNPQRPLRIICQPKACFRQNKLIILGTALMLVIAVAVVWQEGIKYVEIYGASVRSAYYAARGEKPSMIAQDVADSEEKAKHILADKARVVGDLFKHYKHENAYTGLARGKNLLIIQVESLQDNFIGRDYHGQEITPNLNRLIEKSFYFHDYFELLGFGNSSDAEYVSLHSTFSNVKKGAYEDYKDTEAFGLPKIAKSKGYQTFSAHGNTGEFYHRRDRHPAIGFDYVYMGEDYIQDEMIGMGLSDESLFKQSLERIEDLHQKGKFMGFMITLTCHGPFDMPEKDMVFAVREDLKNTTFAKYLNAVYYTDRVLGDFLKELEDRGILQDTVVALYGDHHAFANVNKEDSLHLAEFTGRPYDFDDMMRIPLIIHVPGYDQGLVRENIGSQVDFLPTICNIMGWNDVATPMFGVDLLDDDLSRNNIVYPQTYMLQGSFITDDFMFEKSRIREGIAGRLINRQTREVLPEAEAKVYYDRSFERIQEAQQIYYHDQVTNWIEEFKLLVKNKKI